MTPHEKAKELVKKFDELDYGFCEVDLYCHNSKQCAIIVVEEIIKLPCLTDEAWLSVPDEYKIQYWNEVKTEIEKL